MTQELATRESALALNDPLETKRELLTRTICRGATPDELELFIHACKRTGLDPFMKQIYGIKRKGKLAIQTGIDGYRLIADRTGKYAGNDDPIYSYNDDGFVVKALSTVYKMVEGMKCAFSASARWEEYCPEKGEDFMWRKMPHVMLGKVSEALALRKAFPAELSGVYVSEEMSQAGAGERYDGEEVAPANGTPKLATPEQVRDATDLAAMVEEGIVPKWFAAAKVSTWSQMPTDTIAKCIKRMEEIADARAESSVAAAVEAAGAPIEPPAPEPVTAAMVTDFGDFSVLYGAAAEEAGWDVETAKSVLAKAAALLGKKPETTSSSWRLNCLNNVLAKNIDLKTGRPLEASVTV